MNKEMRGFTINAIAGLLLLGLPLISLQAAESATTERSTQLPEEMIITGQQTFRGMREAINEAEDKIFMLFNDLNDDNQYDIYCRMETRPNTRIKFRTCTPNFYYDARAEEAQSVLTGIPAIPLNSVAGYHYPILAEKMQVIAKEHPELAETMKDYQGLHDEYRETRKDYFAKP